MATTVRCARCGSVTRVPQTDEGRTLTCRSCGQPLPVARAPRRARAERAARGAHHAAATREGHGSADEADKRWARRRIGAAKLCATSVYLCLAAVLGFFVAGWVVVALCGLLAVVVGLWGLLRLGQLGRGPAHAEETPGLLRVAVRMGRTAPAKAWTGIGVGVLMLVVPGWLLLQARADRKRTREDFESSIHEMIAAQDRRVRLLDSLRQLDLDVTPHTVAPDPRARNVRPLPEAELARRLHRVMEIYPETATADVLAGRAAAFPEASGLDVRDEPWVSWLRILREHPAASAAELEPAAVAALAEAVGSDDPEIRDPALDALAELGPKARSAEPAVRRLLEGADPYLQERVNKTLEAMGAP